MPKNYTLDDILNEYSGEEKHKSAVKNKTAVKTEIKSNGQTGKIEDTGYIKIPSGGIPDETITYSVKELEQINAKRFRRGIRSEGKEDERFNPRQGNARQAQKKETARVYL